ncbi:MAG TPA: iron-siderophore ABC transporter substrate-binding protein [Advenella sp.]|nr:iron-siderophore ABC transporter substrate-binding protein [Advenella sp.]
MPMVFQRCMLVCACLMANAAAVGPAAGQTNLPDAASPTEPAQHSPGKAPPQRIAVLDWTIAETMAAMGIFPAAIAEKNSYEIWSHSPVMPESTLDLGMRAQPNPDRMIRLAPELILASQDYAFVKGLLERIGPTTLLDVYTPGQDIYQNLTELATRIGQITGQPDKAAAYTAQVDDQLDAIRHQLVQHRGQPVAIIQFIDARNVRVYGKPSVFSTALEKIGISNAWTAAVNQWGFQSADLTHLAALPKDATIFIIKPYPADLPGKLQENVIWQALPAVRKNRIILAEPIWTLGGLNTVLRFAQTVRDGLLAQDANAGSNAAFRFPGYDK